MKKNRYYSIILSKRNNHEYYLNGPLPLFHPLVYECVHDWEKRYISTVHLPLNTGLHSLDRKIYS